MFNPAQLQNWILKKDQRLFKYKLEPRRRKMLLIAIIWIAVLWDFIHWLKSLNHLVQHHNKQHHRKVLLSSFYLNEHALGFHPRTQKVEPSSQTPSTQHIKGSTGNCRLLAFFFAVVLYDSIRGLSYPPFIVYQTLPAERTALTAAVSFECFYLRISFTHSEGRTT